MKDKKRKLLSLALALQMLTFSGCKSVNNNNDNYKEVRKEIGEHLILKVDKNLDLWYGSEGKYGLSSPKGYVILDYDYDYNGDFEFHDFVYINKEPVIIKNPNNIGMAKDSNSKEMNGPGIYKAGEHVIAEIDRSINLLFGKDNETIELKAPKGYEVIDYDYDKPSDIEYENITYVNKVDVKVTDFNEFGEPIEDYTMPNNTDGYYDIGEHKLVTVNRNLNMLWGKNETKHIVAPKGYKIVDYDYDKNDNFEFETITYENIVPVIKKNEKFGKPLEDIVLNNSDNEYEIGQHVIVKINRNVNLGFGFEGTEALIAPDGYKILDYDYDKNEDFEFETYVYVNNKKIKAEDKNNFGKIIDKEKKLVKVLD